MRAVAAIFWYTVPGCSRQPPAACPIQDAGSTADTPPKVDPRFDAKFWSTWGTERPELSAYDLTFPRYNQLRKGIAVTVFVTEPFSIRSG